MTSSFKLLGATTALLALAAGAASADDVNTNNTSALQTSLTTTGYNVSGSAVVSNSAGLAAIEVSGTGVQNVILVSSSATVTANTVSGTISAGVGIGNGVTATITNRGAINATGGNAVAISLSTLTGAATISTTGTISGSVTTGAGNDIITVEGSTGAITGVVSTSTGDDTLTVRSGGTVTGNVDLGAGANTVNISGSTSSIVGNVVGLTGVDTISNTNALIHGNVDLGAGHNVILMSGSSGKISGTVTTTTGDDTLTVTNSDITGAIDLGAGANVVVISGTSSVVGALTTAGGADTVTIDGARTNSVDLGDAANSLTTRNSAIISGSLATGSGTDTVTLGSGTVISGTTNFGDGTNLVSATSTTFRGNVTLGSGTNTLYLVNSDVSGTLTMGGTDVVYISGSTPFTQKAAFSGINTLNVSDSTVHSRYSMGTIDTLNLQRNSVLNVSTSQVFGTSGVLNVNSGTINIAAGAHVSASTWNFTNNGNLGIHVASSASYGSIGASDFNGGSLTIKLASNAGFINSGTQMLIVSGSGAASILPSLTTTTQGVYTFSVALVDNRDVSLTINRAATSALATNSSNANIGTALDRISSTQNTQLLAVQSLIGSQTSSAGVNNVLDSLNPAGGTGAAMANVGTSVATGNQISGRLAMLRGKGMNTGDGMFSNHFWVQGFGNMTNQDDKDGVKGYDASGFGSSVGIDTDTLVDGMNTGMAFSYGQANVESNATGNANTDVDSYMLTGYGSKTLNDGMFINGQASIGSNTYETDRTIATVGTAHGEFDGMQYGLKGEVGRDYDYEQFTLTPTASLQYTHVDMDAYTETGAGGAGLVVGDQDFDAIDLGLGGQAAWNMPLENGGTLKPILRAKYIYRAGDDSVETTSRFIGGGTNFTTQGVKADKSSFNLGAGLLLSTVGGVDLSVDYDADLRSSLVGHTGQVKARWAF